MSTPATIRLATVADARRVAAIYAPIVEETAISFEVTPPATAVMAHRIRETVPRLPWLVCELERGVIGYAYASLHNDRPAYRWSVNVSVYVDAARRRQGVATALYESLFAVLEEQQLVNAFAGIALPNDESVRFHEACGFEPIGVYRNVGYKLGAWRDVGWWQRVLRELEDPPAEPIHLEDLQGTDRFHEAVRTGEPSVRP